MQKGVVGARSVKWLSKIIVSSKESSSFWQQNDYKLLSPSIKNLKEADFSVKKAFALFMVVYFFRFKTNLLEI